MVMALTSSNFLMIVLSISFWIVLALGQ
jgi:hypothetical protein